MFKTKKERYAYVKGIKKGRAGGKPYREKSSRSIKTATYSRSDKEWDDFFNAAVKKSYGPSSNSKKKSSPYNDFDYDKKGRIKGSYTSDGFFEPD